MDLEARVAGHYAGSEEAATAAEALAQRIFAALEANGLNLRELKAEDLAPVDEFHVLGRRATESVGQSLGLSEGLGVLDVGSGLGGPARFMAERFGARVTGIDLTPHFCAVARLLNERVGLADRVAIHEGSALAMPFESETFEAAYTQHVAMNIEDKPALYREVARVLKPGAPFAVYDIAQGPGGEVHYPAPWAEEPSTSFLVEPDVLVGLLEAAGFRVESRRDRTEEGHAWFEARLATAAAQAEGPKPAGIHVLFGERFKPMGANMVRNLAEKRVALTQILSRKS